MDCENINNYLFPVILNYSKLYLMEYFLLIFRIVTRNHYYIRIVNILLTQHKIML